MFRTNLRKVGGSVMLAVPPSILELLHLGAGSPVGVAVEGGSLVIRPNPRPRYSLEELLAQCEPTADHGAQPAAEDREWLDARPVGSELL